MQLQLRLAWLLAAGARAQPAFETVLHLGDPQLGFSGNATEDEIRFGLAADAAVRRNASAVVIAGDLVNVWDDASQVARFRSVWPSRFPPNVGIVPGNHDVNSMLHTADSVLAQLSHFRTAFGLEDHGVVSTRFARFVLVNSELLILPTLGMNGTSDPRILGPAEAQWRFIEAALAKSARLHQHAVLVMHHPPFLVEEREPHGYYNWPLPPRARLIALARRYGVRLALCGHTHTTTDVATDDGIRVLTVAGTARAFDARGCGYNALRVDASAIAAEYVELPAGGGQPGCVRAPNADWRLVGDLARARAL